MKKRIQSVKRIQNGQTILLRLALIGMGLLVSVIGSGLATAVQKNWDKEFTDITYVKYPITIGLVLVVIIFWIALYYSFRLLDLIDRNKSFSARSVKALQRIKYSAVAIAGLFTAGMPVVFYIAQQDDAPGLVLIVGVIFIGIPLLVAVFAGVCQKLFQNAIDIKQENDLTV